jgi:uncharacterized membrane protein
MPPARVRLFGYPFHPTLVVFPSALFPASILADAAAWLTGDAFWWRAAFWSIGLGLVGTLAAVGVGLLDYPRVPAGRARDVAFRHAAMGFSILGLYAIILWIHTFDPWTTPGVFGTVIGFNLLGQVLLSFQGVWGGRLVYRHGMGSETASRAPASEQERHR